MERRGESAFGSTFDASEDFHRQHDSMACYVEAPMAPLRSRRDGVGGKGGTRALPISVKLALAFLTVLLAGFSAHTALNLRFHAALYRSDAIRDLRIMGRSLASAVESVLPTQGEPSAAELVAKANLDIEGTHIRWIPREALANDPALREHPELPERLAQQSEVRFESDAEEARRLYLYWPVTLGGVLRGAVELSEEIPDEPGLLRRRLTALLALSAAWVAVCGTLCYGVARRWVGRPVHQLMEKARRIGAEDFSGPVELAGHREFAELAAEMNAMAASLEATRARLAKETSARIAALEQLRHADRLSTIGRLAAGVAHELGTPLNVVSERAEMIAEGEHEDPDELARSARVIQQQSERMASIVRQLLDFARRRRPDRCVTQLDELARATARLMAPLLDRREVKARTSEGGDAVWCEVDPGQIQQVLVNLITNAVDVTPPGGEVRLAVDAPEGSPAGRDPGGRWVRVVVEDDGPGIPAELLPRIFEPFFTTKPSGRGTGLGLAVADEIVREHGGSIEAGGAPGGGSRLSVWLPRGEAR